VKEKRENVKKIVLIVGSANVGGAEKQIVTLASHLNENSFDCHIIFLIKGGPLEEMAQKLNVTYSISNLSKQNFFKSLINLFQLIKTLKEQCFDVHYLFLPHSILYLGPILRRTSRNTTLAYGIRGSIHRKNNLFYRLYRREIIKADVVVCNSKDIQNELSGLNNMNPSKIRLIHNGVDPKTVNRVQLTGANLKQNNKIVVLANFHPYKGYDLLLDSLELIKDPSLSLTFIGDGEVFCDIQNRTLRISHHKFNLLGQVKDVSEILATQRFAIHPSRTEGLSNAILEELSVGLPVIAFDVGGNRELISNYHNGFLVQLGDTYDLANKIKILCSDDSLLRQMSANALESIKDFTWQKNVQDHLDCFR
jgi:L-malate glycosyltransferase